MWCITTAFPTRLIEFFPENPGFNWLAELYTRGSAPALYPSSYTRRPVARPPPLKLDDTTIHVMWLLMMDFHAVSLSVLLYTSPLLYAYSLSSYLNPVLAFHLRQHTYLYVYSINEFNTKLNCESMGSKVTYLTCFSPSLLPTYSFYSNVKGLCMWKWMDV